MGITFDDQQIASKDGVPYIIPRDANFDTMALLGGFDSSNNFKFGKFNSSGQLMVDASVAPGLLRVLNSADAEITLYGGLNPDADTNFLYVQDQRMGFTGGSLNANITASALPNGAATETTLVDILEALGGSSSVSKESLFDSKEVEANTPTTILEYAVPSGKKFRIDAVRGWADVDAEYYVMIDSDQVDGYRTTPAQLTMNIEQVCAQYAAAGQLVVIGATHFKNGPSRTMKAILQGALETI